MLQVHHQPPVKSGLGASGRPVILATTYADIANLMKLQMYSLQEC